MTFLSALILGLLAGAHCAGMCGGLQMAMQGGVTRDIAVRSKREAFAHLILMNLGRITTYVAGGVVFTFLGYELLNGLNISTVSKWFRVLTGIVIVAIGLQLIIGKWRPFQFIEPLGALLWRRVSRLIDHSTDKRAQSLITGLAWGFLPCGLVYSVLFVSVLSNNVLSAGLIMLGFGLGTLPALAFSGLLYKQFKDTVSSSLTQFAGGVFFLIGGSLILVAPYWVKTGFLLEYPELLNLAFCVA